jgi:flagellar basal-body rod protein FlgB
MDNTAPSWLNTASQKLNWLGERQRVITENVANADTPGYVAREVEPFEDYLSRTQNPSAAVKVQNAKNSWGTSLDGNGVVLEEQSILAAETHSQHQLATRLYGKAYNMMSMVTGN